MALDLLINVPSALANTACLYLSGTLWLVWVLCGWENRNLLLLLLLLSVRSMLLALCGYLLQRLSAIAPICLLPTRFAWALFVSEALFCVGVLAARWLTRLGLHPCSLCLPAVILQQALLTGGGSVTATRTVLILFFFIFDMNRLWGVIYCLYVFFIFLFELILLLFRFIYIWQSYFVLFFVSAIGIGCITFGYLIYPLSYWSC